MKLLTLSLENFQGIRNATYRFDGKSADVFGGNGAGKTTLYNAVTWLLFDKSSEGIANFIPKPWNDEGKYVHNLESSAEAAFENGGEVVTLKRVFSEDWQRKNGDTESKFKGHKNGYLIDGVETRARDFKDFIESVLPTDKVKILSSPLYFASNDEKGMAWQERRQILFEMNGEVSDADVIAANPDLAELPELLGKHTVEQYQSICKKACKDINDELAIIPARIDEAEKSKPDLTGLAIPDIDAALEAAEAEKAEKQEAKANMGGSEAAANARAQIAELEAEFAEKKRTYIADINAENEGTYAAISRLDGEISALRRQISENESIATAQKASAMRMEKRRGELTSSYKATKGEAWHGETSCYACGKPIDADKIEDAQNKFAANKQTKLDKVCQEVAATCSKEMQEAAENKAYALTDDVDADKIRLNALTIKRDGLNAAIKPNDFAATDYAAATTAQIAKLRRQATDGEGTVTAARQRIDAQIAEIIGRIAKLTTDKAKFGIAEESDKRIAAHAAREKEIAAQFEKFQKGLALCDDFTRAKSRFISETICAKFRTVSFRFFKNQVNGGLQECCDVLVPCKLETGEKVIVPFNEANNAARVVAGIEIIDALSDLWGVSLPLILDERGEVTDIIDTNVQVISLFVEPADKVLRVEIKPNKEENYYVA